MAKLITKFKYLKPNARQSVGGYAKYIATREGVEKIDQSYRLSPSSQKQQQLIEEIIKDFPDSKEMLEYEDYLKEPTVGNASEFITRALEDNAYEVMQTNEWNASVRNIKTSTKKLIQQGSSKPTSTELTPRTTRKHLTERSARSSCIPT